MEHGTNQSQNKRPIIEFKTALLFVLILAGLFIAALAFIGDMSHSEATEHETHGTTHEGTTGEATETTTTTTESESHTAPSHNNTTNEAGGDNQQPVQTKIINRTPESKHIDSGADKGVHK